MRLHRTGFIQICLMKKKNTTVEAKLVSPATYFPSFLLTKVKIILGIKYDQAMYQTRKRTVSYKLSE